MASRQVSGGGHRAVGPGGDLRQAGPQQDLPGGGPFGGRDREDGEGQLGPQRGVHGDAVPLDAQHGAVPVRAVGEVQALDPGHPLAECGVEVRRGERPRQVARQATVSGWHDPSVADRAADRRLSGRSVGPGPAAS
ncbi:hypothetical protein GCM10009664_59070 [Kitasatospora gansuensis]